MESAGKRAAVIFAQRANAEALPAVEQSCNKPFADAWNTNADGSDRSAFNTLKASPFALSRSPVSHGGIQPAGSSSDIAEPEPDAEDCYRPFKRALRERVHFVVEHKSVAGDATVTLLSEHSANAQCLKWSLKYLGPDELEPPIVVRGVLSVVITPLTITPE